MAGWIVLLLIAGGAAIWWAARWTPGRADYPVQGVSISAANGSVAWGRVKAAGAEFAYIAATDGVGGSDARFAANREGAAAQGIRSGAVHRYRLCSFAADQAANFIRNVPRDPAALPTAVWLELDEDCAAKPSRALLLSELTTFLAQIEAHMGKRSIIAPSASFDAEYELSRDVARTTWVRGFFFMPSYGAHDWTMWQASDYVRISGAEGTVGWNVVRGDGDGGQ
ncbi:MAG: glycoside hydrolase [Sphingopyxis sp.]|nr:glycoside hydrolase [Sphingopyxis sp.]